MIKLPKIEYPEDCIRIKRVLLDHGCDASLWECEKMWKEYSESMCAGWLFLPESDEDLFSILDSGDEE